MEDFTDKSSMIPAPSQARINSGIPTVLCVLCSSNNNSNNNNGIYLYRCLISAQALFSRRALFGATRIHSYTRMDSLIRAQKSDLFATRSIYFQQGILWVQWYPRMETFHQGRYLYHLWTHY